MFLRRSPEVILLDAAISTMRPEATLVASDVEESANS